MDVDGCGWPVAPQYGDSVATSLKNVQNLPKSSKLRQNSVLGGICMDVDGCMWMYI